MFYGFHVQVMNHEVMKERHILEASHGTESHMGASRVIYP